MDNQLNNDVLNKKPKSFDSNKLINPDIEEEEDDDEELIDETIDELDDETIEIINRIRMKNINRDDTELDYFQEKPKSLKKEADGLSKKSSKKTKKVLSLQEFTKVTQTESKPPVKKFTSNRVEHKKKQNDTNIVITKRQFNPRKPPYNFNRKITADIIPELNNINEFPELK